MHLSNNRMNDRLKNSVFVLSQDALHRKYNFDLITFIFIIMSEFEFSLNFAHMNVNRAVAFAIFCQGIHQNKSDL